MLRKQNIFPKIGHKRYNTDQTYFDKIDHQNKVYILGLLYADGSNNINYNSSVVLSLQESDIDILEKITMIVQLNRPIKIRVDKRPTRKNMAVLTIGGNIISKKLAELGCIPNKTFKIVFPNFLSPEMIPHFIRGYWDGDGYVPKRNCSIIGTEDLCLGIQKVLKETLSINSTIRIPHPETNSNNYIRELRISGRKQNKTLMDFLYKDAELYMDRKFNIYDNEINY